MTRRTIALLVLALWVIGVGWLGYRQTHKSDWERLASVAMQVSPSAYYYNVYHGDTQIGVASSSIDTAHGMFVMRDFIRGRLPIAGDTQAFEGGTVAHLSRRLALDSFTVSLAYDHRTITTHGTPQKHTAPVFLPTFAPIPLMLMDDPKIGRTASAWVYNPVSDAVERATLRIQAESLFTVSDSARYDSTQTRWVSVRHDTVRAWSVTTPTAPVTVWVDREGRLVSVSEPGGLHLLRTAYEEAFENWRLRQH